MKTSIAGVATEPTISDNIVANSAQKRVKFGAFCRDLSYLGLDSSGNDLVSNLKSI